MKPFYLLALFISILFVDFEKNNELKLPEHQKLNFKEGDILFQKLPEGELANAIVDITGSDYSHCGILVRNDSGVLVVVEAYIRVICMPLEAWIARGVNKGFAVYRVKTVLDEKIQSVIDSAKAMIGMPYDYDFAWDDEKLYCSELVYKTFERATGNTLGALTKLGDMYWKKNEKFIRKVKKGNLPLDQEIISPIKLAGSDFLECVYSFKLDK